MESKEIEGLQDEIENLKLKTIKYDILKMLTQGLSDKCNVFKDWLKDYLNFFGLKAWIAKINLKIWSYLLLIIPQIEFILLYNLLENRETLGTGVMVLEYLDDLVIPR